MTTQTEEADRTQTKRPQRTENLINLMFKNHFSITWRVFLLSVLPAVVLGSLGYLADTALSTKPLFIIIGVLVAFVVSQALNIKVIGHLTNKQ